MAGSGIPLMRCLFSFLGKVEVQLGEGKLPPMTASLAGLGADLRGLGHLIRSSCSPRAEVGQVQGGRSDSYVHLLKNVRCHDIDLLRVYPIGRLEFSSKFVDLGAGWAEGDSVKETCCLIQITEAVFIASDGIHLSRLGGWE
eukprot:4697138-Ditylum_brightwellii.AAC.1